MKTLEVIQDFCIETKDFFVTAGKVLYYLSHPKQLAWILWNGLVQYSLPIFIFICLLSLILYMCGWKKIRRIISGSFFGYVVIQMINAAL